MRKLLVASLTAATALSSLAMTTAAEPDRGRPGQYVQGNVDLPTRFTDGEQGWPGLARRVHQCSAALNGTIGYVLPIWEESWGGEFVLEYTGDETGIGDLDVLFYEDLADCGGQQSAVTAGPYYDARGDATGESGIVPDRARYAIVYMATGAQATFAYEDWEPPVLAVTDAGGEVAVTVRAGGVLRIENGTSSYLEVDAPGTAQDRVGDGNGLRVGEELRLRLDDEGTHTVTAGATTITVTVLP